MDRRRGGADHAGTPAPDVLAGHRLASLQRRQHLFDRGVAFECSLGEQQLLVACYFEAATLRWLQDEFADLCFEPDENLLRQPDGARCVVSSRAILDRDAHTKLL